MTILLDTGVLLRLTADSGEIGAPFKEDVESGVGHGAVAVSTVTFVETTRLHHHERVDLGCHPAVWRRERLRSGLREIPISGDIAVESVLLMNTGFHSDPADQPIVATAMLEGMRLATTDRRIIGWAQRTRPVPLVDPAAGTHASEFHGWATRRRRFNELTCRLARRLVVDARVMPVDTAALRCGLASGERYGQRGDAARRALPFGANVGCSSSLRG